MPQLQAQLPLLKALFVKEETLLNFQFKILSKHFYTHTNFTATSFLQCLGANENIASAACN